MDLLHIIAVVALIIIGVAIYINKRNGYGTLSHYV
jgi:hypothetical protein